MNRTKQILAVIGALAVFGAAIFFAVISHKVKYILADLGDVALPEPTQIFLSIPTWGFLIVGGACAGAIGLTIWRLRRAWLAIPSFLLTVVLLLMFFGVFCISMFIPVAGLIGKAQEIKAQEGEQRN